MLFTNRHLLTPFTLIMKDCLKEGKFPSTIYLTLRQSIAFIVKYLAYLVDVTNQDQE